METRIATTPGGIMSRPVVTVPPGLEVGAIARLIREHRISGIPVVDPQDNVLGLVSEYDLLAETGGAAAEPLPAAVINVSPDTAIANVRRLLVNPHIGRLPVLSGGRLVGIISRGDLVALLATEWVCGICGERPAVSARRPAVPNVAVKALDSPCRSSRQGLECRHSRRLRMGDGGGAPVITPARTQDTAHLEESTWLNDGNLKRRGAKHLRLRLRTPHISPRTNHPNTFCAIAPIWS